MASLRQSSTYFPVEQIRTMGGSPARLHRSKPAKGRVEGLATAEANHGSPSAPAASFNLTVQELALINSYRKLPNDERRQGVLEAMEMLCHAYD